MTDQTDQTEDMPTSPEPDTSPLMGVYDGGLFFVDPDEEIGYEGTR